MYGSSVHGCYAHATKSQISRALHAINYCTRYAVILSDWSRQLDVSEKTLARTFVRETGLNFSKWQNKLRMYSAKKDIDAGLKVTDAALNCGYNSLSSFIAAFKKSYGHTPGALNR